MVHKIVRPISSVHVPQHHLGVDHASRHAQDAPVEDLDPTQASKRKPRQSWHEVKSKVSDARGRANAPSMDESKDVGCREDGAVIEQVRSGIAESAADSSAKACHDPDRFKAAARKLTLRMSEASTVRHAQ